VDHRARRRQITDAVCRLTVRGGLPSATFREVAAEAGVSVRLVQYYFGTKAELLLSTQRHVAERATQRALAAVAASDGTPQGELRALLGSFIPVDAASREHLLVFVALHTATLVDPTAAHHDTRDVPAGLHEAIRARLTSMRLRAGVDPRLEASLLAGLVPSLGQGVLDGLTTAEEAFAVLDYALGRAILATPRRTRA
jgi:AcrR family transcriptional regulator